MPAVTVAVDISATPERVWAFLSDVRRVPDWVSNAERLLSIPDQPTRVGAVFREVTRFGGPFKGRVEWTFTVLDPHALAVHRGRLPFMGETDVVYRLTPSGAGTRFEYELAWRWRGVMRLLGPFVFPILVRPKLRADLTRNARNAKRLIEAERNV